jgi:hypothetical protein
VSVDSDFVREGYVDLDGEENRRRLRDHQAYLVGIGVPAEVTQTLDHIGVNAASRPAFERLLERYSSEGDGTSVYDRGDRRIAIIERGGGNYRVELFEPREGAEPTPGFVHYAFIWPGWKEREAELRRMADVRRTGELNGNHLAFVATPDGYEAEIVSEPIQFQ